VVAYSTTGRSGVRILSGARDFSLVRDVQVRMSNTVPLPSWHIQGTTLPDVLNCVLKPGNIVFPVMTGEVGWGRKLGMTQ